MPGSVGQSLTTIMKTVTTPVVVVDDGQLHGGHNPEHLYIANDSGLLSTPFVIQPTQGRYGCIYQRLPFTARKGEAISVDVKSSIPISLYIMTAADYRAWVNGNSCSALASSVYNKQVFQQRVL